MLLLRTNFIPGPIRRLRGTEPGGQERRYTIGLASGSVYALGTQGPMGDLECRSVEIVYIYNPYNIYTRSAPYISNLNPRVSRHSFV